MLGKTTPRLWTRPLIEGPPGPCGCGCALTEETTLGFAVEWFARDILKRPLFPWQRWLVIHALELLPNGWPRFRQVLVLVARQNGKTELLVILSLFWMWIQQVGIVLGTSTKLQYARESWQKAVKLARKTPELRSDIAQRGAVRQANGEQEMSTPWDSRYLIAPAKTDGGRSLTVARLIEDELREHHDNSAHEAAENAMNAVDDAQAWAITNEGDDRSVVLHELYDAALLFIETGEGDRRLGLFAYSAIDGCDLLDIEETAQANPSLNLEHGVNWENLVGKARRAKIAGGDVEAKYRTEVLCQRVQSLDPQPITVEMWNAQTDSESSIAEGRAVVLTAEIALDRKSASIGVAGFRPDGDMHVEVIVQDYGTEWLLPRLRDLAETWDLYEVKRGTGKNKKTCQAIVIDPNSPAGGLVDPLRRPWFDDDGKEHEGIEPVLMTARELSAACGDMQDALIEGTVHHPDQSEVADAWKNAIKRDLGDGGWALGRLKSAKESFDITPAVTVTNARWGLSIVEPEPDPDIAGFY